MTGKGIDAVTTELCVTAPMDAGGYARPRVLLGALISAELQLLLVDSPVPLSRAPDVTNALRRLGIMVFKASTAIRMPHALRLTCCLQADIHTARIPGKPLQEVHRFLLTDAFGQPIDDPVLRDRVVKQVRRTLAAPPVRLHSPTSGDQVRGGLLG